jgi:hypothetical protein
MWIEIVNLVGTTGGQVAERKRSLNRNHDPEDADYENDNSENCR